MESSNDFHPKNTASALIAKIGGGTADADFGRAMKATLDRVRQTRKNAKIVLTIEVVLREDLKDKNDHGCIELRASVEAKLPKLSPPATQMHVGNDGQLLSQQELWFSGGEPEIVPRPVAASAAASTSGRFAVAKAPALAPVADAPALAAVSAAPAPVRVGKDAAAGPN